MTLTVVAVVLPLWWQSVEQGKYNDQLVIGLKIELSQNWATINNARQVLEDNINLLEKENRIDTRPLLDLRFNAWQRAVSGPGDFLGKLGRKNTAGYLKLQYCYSVLRIIQEKMDNRESYRYLQEAQPWYVDRMKQLDKEILSKLDKAKQLIETAQEFLYQIHDWRVAGESFSVDAGLVTTDSKAAAVSQQPRFLMNEFTGVATVVALVVNTLALLFVICQTWLAKRSLSATRESLDDARLERQLEVLPKFGWVIQVQVDLEKWQKDLLEKRQQLEGAVQIRDATVLQNIAEKSPKQPRELGLRKVVYDSMPSWIREIWISGAQYYYDAASPLLFVWRDGTPNFEYAEKWVSERGKESEKAISTLLTYTKDMIPPVILNTPASLSERDFLT